MPFGLAVLCLHAAIGCHGLGRDIAVQANGMLLAEGRAADTGLARAEELVEQVGGIEKNMADKVGSPKPWSVENSAPKEAY